jgi:nucleoside-diphosphate-sugar epimerase
VQYIDWPPEKKAIDIGSFYADSTRFKRLTGWVPTVLLEEGLGRTVAFCRQHFGRYVEAANRPERV